MKSIALRLFGITICFLVLACQAQSEKSVQKILVDPLLGLTLNLSELENMKIEQSLLEDIGLDTFSKFWILSSTKEKELKYYIIVGLVPVYKDVPNGSLLGYDSDSGLVVIENTQLGSYESIGSPDVVFDYMPKNPISDEVLKTLANNYISTLTSVLGEEILKDVTENFDNLPLVIKESIATKTN